MTNDVVYRVDANRTDEYGATDPEPEATGQAPAESAQAPAESEQAPTESEQPRWSRSNRPTLPDSRPPAGGGAAGSSNGGRRASRSPTTGSWSRKAS